MATAALNVSPPVALKNFSFNNPILVLCRSKIDGIYWTCKGWTTQNKKSRHLWLIDRCTCGIQKIYSTKALEFTKIFLHQKKTVHFLRFAIVQDWEYAVLRSSNRSEINTHTSPALCVHVGVAYVGVTVMEACRERATPKPLQHALITCLQPSSLALAILIKVLWLCARLSRDNRNRTDLNILSTLRTRG